MVNKGILAACCLRSMKLLAVLGLVILYACPSLLGQKLNESDSLARSQPDSLSTEPERKLGFWLAAYVEPPGNASLSGYNAGAGASFVYKRRYHVGVYGLVYMGDYQSRLIFPNRFSFHYAHFGVWTGARVPVKDFLFLTGDLKVGEGKVFWERADNFYNMFEDYVLFVNPTIGADIVLFKYLAVHAGVGYRHVEGMNVPQFGDENFSGLSVNLMIKLGWF